MPGTVLDIKDRAVIITNLCPNRIYILVFAKDWTSVPPPPQECPETLTFSAIV